MTVLSTALPDGRHQCLLCPHRCSLRNGQAGICMARVGSANGIDLEAYGKLTQLAVEPIEKKPIWHYRPGLRVLSAGGYGCSFSCDYCQNWMVSQRDNAPKKELSPNDLVRLALDKGCGGICFTYNEPIVYFEYVMDVAREAKVAGLDLILKTNAYAEQEPWDDLVGVNVDRFISA